MSNSKTIHATIDFLDAYGRVYKVVTKQADYVCIELERYGTFVGLDSERKKLTRVESMKSWLKEKDIKIKDIKDVLQGYFAVRDQFPRTLVLDIPEQFVAELKIWINISIPAEDLVDFRNIRVDAYMDKSAAENDAADEMNRVGTLSVITKPVTLKVP